MPLFAFIVTSLIAALLAVFVPADVGIEVVRGSGSWLIAQLFVLWLLVLGLSVWPHRSRWRSWLPRWPEVLLIGLGTAFLVSRESPGFKVTMDELMLAATAMSLHFGRSAEAIVRGYEVQGVFEALADMLDKRPLLYPWLVSVLHDVTGYRMSNSFWLNGGLTAILLTLVYRAARWLHDWRAGVLAVLALVFFPLLAQNATGGGFEILNAVLVVSTLLAAAHYVREPGTLSQGVLIFSTVLLANARYESLLYVVATGLVIVGEWVARRRLLIRWPLVLAPLVLLPAVWHLRRFNDTEAFWQLGEGVASPFALEFVPRNLGHFLSYLVDFSRSTTAWPVLGIVAPFGLGLLLLFLIRYRSRLVAEGRGDRLTAAPYVLVMLANLGVLLSYHWGQVDSYEVARLLLPFFVLGAVAASTMLFQLVSPPRGFVPAVVVLVVGAYVWTLPAMAKADATRANFYAQRMEWAYAFHEELPPGNYLYITRGPLYFILNRVSAIHTGDLTRVLGRIRHHLERKTFNDVYVVQSYLIDPATGEEWVLPGDEVGPAFELEPVRERMFRPYVITRVSRVVRIDPARQPVNDPLPDALRPEWSGDEIGPAYQDYGDEWLKRLP